LPSFGHSRRSFYETHFVDPKVRAEPRASTAGVLSILAEKYPPTVLGYVLIFLGLFDIPSMFILAAHNEVVPYQDLDR